MTTTTPRRISTLQYLGARIAVALGLEPDYPGADWPQWEQELHAMRRTQPTAVGRAAVPRRRLARRQPIAAIAATAHTEAVCPLDACPLDLGPLQSAPLFDDDRYAQIGATA